MDPSCFTTAQRLSCKMMNPDMFKASPAAPPPAKPSRSKSEHVKPELAQVVVDAKTGRSYCKGKLLGKVRCFLLTGFIGEFLSRCSNVSRVRLVFGEVFIMGAPEPLDRSPPCPGFYTIYLMVIAAMHAAFLSNAKTSQLICVWD